VRKNGHTAYIWNQHYSAMDCDCSVDSSSLRIVADTEIVKNGSDLRIEKNKGMGYAGQKKMMYR
jgi:hypothetical protein